MGSHDEAYKLACLDNDQHTITAIHAHMGSPDHRSTMQFLVQFANNISLWLPWSRDLSDSIPFGEYCQSILYLYIVSLTVSIANQFIRMKRNEHITSVQPGEHVWVNLRFFGTLWYEALSIEDKHLND